MPELPDINLYLERLRERTVGQPLRGLRVFSPFVLRSFAVKPSEVEGRLVEGVERLGKRIVFDMESDYFIVLHLMIAGRLQWITPLPPDKRSNGKIVLASFRFDEGQLNLVEFSSKKRASLYLLRGREALVDHRRSGQSVFELTPDEFHQLITQTNRTLKRMLTDPATLDGIGNAYSDEILFHARLSPVRRTQSLTPEESRRLLEACRSTLEGWAARLLRLYPGFPKPGDVTAFRDDFATHGQYGKPCPECGAPIQRIVYAENETNYCARCQNEGRLLADRSLSRLLKEDWPKTVEELEGD